MDFRCFVVSHAPTLPYESYIENHSPPSPLRKTKTPRGFPGRTHLSWCDLLKCCGFSVFRGECSFKRKVSSIKCLWRRVHMYVHILSYTYNVQIRVNHNASPMAKLPFVVTSYSSSEYLSLFVNICYIPFEPWTCQLGRSFCCAKVEMT